MAIKRGVSFYSYQQAGFFGKMNWKDMIHEVHDNLGTDGVEIIDEMTIPDYPFPSDRFIGEWKEEIEKYHMNPVTMDVFLDVHQFRDHVMTYDEAADRLKRDIVLASKLGFKNVRTLVLVPIEVIEKALPTAEKYNIRIGKEIHAPLSIKPGASASLEQNMLLDPRSVDQIIELAQKTGSKHVGLVPDFGIFQYAPTQLQVDYMKRATGNPEMIDFIVNSRFDVSVFDMQKILDEKYPGHPFSNTNDLRQLMVTQMYSQPEDLKDIIPYIVSIHGKFFHMTPVEGKEGSYEDKSINYKDPIRVLKECGFDGYIDSEFEGQGFCQDGTPDQMIDEVDQVRKHHAMLKELIGE